MLFLSLFVKHLLLDSVQVVPLHVVSVFPFLGVLQLILKFFVSHRFQHPLFISLGELWQTFSLDVVLQLFEFVVVPVLESFHFVKEFVSVVCIFLLLSFTQFGIELIKVLLLLGLFIFVTFFIFFFL